MNVLITGIAGFIGYSLAQRLLSEGFSVYGIDNLNNYYDVSLKESQLKNLKTFPNLTFQKIDLCEREKIRNLFCSVQFDYIFYLAAQTGVRYSIENPFAYGDSNLSDFLNILEVCRNAPPKHFVFASSSSVYGAAEISRFVEWYKEYYQPIFRSLF